MKSKYFLTYDWHNIMMAKDRIVYKSLDSDHINKYNGNKKS
jgi:hypothetical protein